MSKFTANLYDQYLKLQDTREVRVSDDPVLPIASIKYTQSAINWENPLLLMARGLVIDTKGNIIAKPYNKFFNYNQLDYLKTKNRKSLDPNFCQHLNTLTLPSDAFIELHSDWDDSIKPIAVSDKLDGSLMIVTTYKNQLMAFSSGSTSGQYCNYFIKILKDSLNQQELIDLTNYLNDRTLLFEYINSKQDPHVIYYNYVGFKLHGMVDNKTFVEYTDKNSLTKIANRFGFEIVDFYDNLNTKQKVLDYINEVDNKEGVVVTLENGIHLKVKTQQYRDNFSKMSTIFSNVINKRIKANILKNIINDSLDDLLPYASPVVLDEINRINTLVKNYDNGLIPLMQQMVTFSKKANNRVEFYHFAYDFLSQSNYAIYTKLISVIMREYNDGTFDLTHAVTSALNKKELIVGYMLQNETSQESED